MMPSPHSTFYISHMYYIISLVLTHVIYFVVSVFMFCSCNVILFHNDNDNDNEKDFIKHKDSL